MNKKVAKKESRSASVYLGLVLKVCFMLTILFLYRGHTLKAEAGTTQVSVNVNYLEGLAYISPGTGASVKFYFSTDLKTWQPLDSNVLDITPLLKSKEVTIYFKGNSDTTQASVILQAEDISLKAAYQVANGLGRIAISNVSTTVEYRYGANGEWIPLSGYSIPTANYEYMGATINIRTMATSTKRAGKIVNVTVPRKPSTPSVKLDGSKLSFTGLKSGVTQYRLGDSTVWLTFNPSNVKTTTMDLMSLSVNNGLATNAQLSYCIVEFRTMATIKQVASNIKQIEVPLQPLIPDTITQYSNMLSIVGCSSKKAYEYSVVKSGALLNLSTARWISVTTPKAVKISNVVLGDSVYVRLKSYTDTTTKNVIPASTYKIYPITSISS